MVQTCRQEIRTMNLSTLKNKKNQREMLRVLHELYIRVSRNRPTFDYTCIRSKLLLEPKLSC